MMQYIQINDDQSFRLYGNWTENEINHALLEIHKAEFDRGAVDGFVFINGNWAIQKKNGDLVTYFGVIITSEEVEKEMEENAGLYIEYCKRRLAELA